VLGARQEGMPEQRRLAGTVERYAAFLEDHPASPRVPVVRASLIRNLIALKRVDEARAEFEKLKRDHPDDQAPPRPRGALPHRGRRPAVFPGVSNIARGDGPHRGSSRQGAASALLGHPELAVDGATTRAYGAVSAV
jgi:hypothetical protein